MRLNHWLKIHRAEAGTPALHVGSWVWWLVSLTPRAQLRITLNHWAGYVSQQQLLLLQPSFFCGVFMPFYSLSTSCCDSLQKSQMKSEHWDQNPDGQDDPETQRQHHLRTGWKYKWSHQVLDLLTLNFRAWYSSHCFHRPSQRICCLLKCDSWLPAKMEWKENMYLLMLLESSNREQRGDLQNRYQKKKKSACAPPKFQGTDKWLKIRGELNWPGSQIQQKGYGKESEHSWPDVLFGEQEEAQGVLERPFHSGNRKLVWPSGQAFVKNEFIHVKVPGSEGTWWHILFQHKGLEQGGFPVLLQEDPLFYPLSLACSKSKFATFSKASFKSPFQLYPLSFLYTISLDSMLGL